MPQETSSSLVGPTLDLDERLTFTTAGETSSAFVNWYAERLRGVMTRQGHIHRTLNGALVMDAVPEGTPARRTTRDISGCRPQGSIRAGSKPSVATSC
jgi:hypothetical protein